MNLDDLKTSKFLKKEDVGNGVLVTIRGITKENTSMEGAEPEHKAVVHFDEMDKPMVLNPTNGQIIAQITGIDKDIERAWIGKKIVLYTDPNVQYKGKIVGGIRVRAPKLATLPVKPVPFIPEPIQQQVDDGLPF
jgi:uncharacterized OB-fold protein